MRILLTISKLNILIRWGAYYDQADIVITRSGSNAIAECLLLGKKIICVPLSSTQSRGEQTLNAEFTQKYGNAIIIDNKELEQETFLTGMLELEKQPVNDFLKIDERELVERIKEHVQFIINKASLKGVA